jgi:hypothetical protein
VLNQSSAVVSNLELRSFEFLLVFFVSQAEISVRGEVNRLETWLITRGVVMLRLQGSVFDLDLKPDWCVTLRLKR